MHNDDVRSQEEAQIVEKLDRAWFTKGFFDIGDLHVRLRRVDVQTHSILISQLPSTSQEVRGARICGMHPDAAGDAAIGLAMPILDELDVGRHPFLAFLRNVAVDPGADLGELDVENLVGQDSPQPHLLDSSGRCCHVMINVIYARGPKTDDFKASQ